ncbi:MAG TPA: globin domain-containing protein [Burkholderiaceae bacterium]|nr:globin domain-containing protein [Burkholderiaceae bacterium]
MTPQEIQLIRSSFNLLATDSATVARDFYRSLFEMDPGLRTLFDSDLEAQGKKLMQMLALVVNGLDRFDELVPALHLLGQRHGRYGVRRYDFHTVGTALLATLRACLGDAYTEDAHAAWANAYGLLAREMRVSMGDGDTEVAEFWASAGAQAS